ncbi:hypothetical protein BpHYR1_046852, partial [Brachionus plicatilis]
VKKYSNFIRDKNILVNHLDVLNAKKRIPEHLYSIRKFNKDLRKSLSNYDKCSESNASQDFDLCTKIYDLPSHKKSIPISFNSVQSTPSVSLYPFCQF